MAERVIYIDSTERIAEIFGSRDANASIIERELNVVLINRDIEIKITGNDKSVSDAEQVISYLDKLLKLSGQLTEQNVQYAVSLIKDGNGALLDKISTDVLCISAKGKPIKPKTLGQKEYIDAIKDNTITLGIGPAGTGKTFLAVAMAISALRRKEVNKLIITRPAVEAGERLGFLPGDIQSKIDPYLRPLYDALYELMGYEGFQRQYEKGIIEVAPLAYMRGRTLDDSFIILDEAQNTTPEQMKMFLTRLGFNSKMVVNGDITQIDLPAGTRSGLKDVMRILKDIRDIKIITLTSRDVVRHSLVSKIVEAYEKHAAEKARYKPDADGAERWGKAQGRASGASFTGAKKYIKTK
ncbi:PhoH-like protein [bioreactor metagenome]|uniref:PhoH-like protein n=1 Tax=bioreactor metagenome TaxID=1076179 RepID=A0A644YXR6_9ZZZZ|nr:PhoH family protein [Oscillospiraceae bacterium]